MLRSMSLGWGAKEPKVRDSQCKGDVGECRTAVEAFAVALHQTGRGAKPPAGEPRRFPLISNILYGGRRRKARRAAPRPQPCPRFATIGQVPEPEVLLAPGVPDDAESWVASAEEAPAIHGSSVGPWLAPLPIRRPSRRTRPSMGHRRAPQLAPLAPIRRPSWRRSSRRRAARGYRWHPRWRQGAPASAPSRPARRAPPSPRTSASAAPRRDDIGRVAGRPGEARREPAPGDGRRRGEAGGARRPRGAALPTC